MSVSMHAFPPDNSKGIAACLVLSYLQSSSIRGLISPWIILRQDYSIRTVPIVIGFRDRGLWLGLGFTVRDGVYIGAVLIAFPILLHSVLFLLLSVLFVCGSVAEWLGFCTCDQQVPLPIFATLGKLFIHVPLVPSSIIWYRHKLGQDWTEEEPMPTQLKRRKRKWFGHTLRRDETCIPKQSFCWKPDGHRKTGRPKNTWRWNLDKEIQDNGMNWRQVEAAAQDRQGRRRLVCGLCSTGTEET